MSHIPVPTFRNDESISSIEITESTVFDMLCELKVNKAPGPDGLHSYVLKAGAGTICIPLTILYSQSLACGELPDERKQAQCLKGS